MKGTPAVYLGRIVDKKNFRAFVYGINGERKLVESWDEFEAAMQIGIWFESVEDAKACKEIADTSEQIQDEVKEEVKAQLKTKLKPASKSKLKEDVQKSERIPDDGMGFEVTDSN